MIFSNITISFWRIAKGEVINVVRDIRVKIFRNIPIKKTFQNIKRYQCAARSRYFLMKCQDQNKQAVFSGHFPVGMRTSQDWRKQWATIMKSFSIKISDTVKLFCKILWGNISVCMKVPKYGNIGHISLKNIKIQFAGRHEYTLQ